MLLGTPHAGAFGTFLRVERFNEYYSFYVWDGWRTKSKLTSKRGLRNEVGTPRYDKEGRLDSFGFDVVYPLTDMAEGVGTLNCGSCFATVDGNPRHHFDADGNNSAPRPGFAYQSNSKPVLRGGSGCLEACGEGCGPVPGPPRS